MKCGRNQIDAQLLRGAEGTISSLLSQENRLLKKQSSPEMTFLSHLMIRRSATGRKSLIDIGLKLHLFVRRDRVERRFRKISWTAFCVDDSCRRRSISRARLL